MEEVRTIKQAAEELGIPKQKVYRFAKKHFNALQQETGNGTITLTNTQFEEVKQHFLKQVHQETHRDLHQTESYDAILKQLEFANSQLKEKDHQIETLQQLLNQSQQLQLAEKQELLSLQDTIKQEKATKAAEESTQNEKKSFFQRFFGKEEDK